MKYQVLTHESVPGLEEAVNTALQDGWKVCGGVSFTEYFSSWTNSRKGGEESETTTVLAQAMIKE